MKKLHQILLLFFIALFLAVIPTYAQEEETSEATNSASFENIKQIIKENLENNKVKGAIDNLLNRKQAYIGEVTRVTDETITISNRLGSQIVPITEAFSITKDGDPIEISDIAVENWVLVLGRIVDDTFSPLFIEVSTKTLRPKNQFVTIGTITEIGKSSITIQPRSGASTLSVDLKSTTEYQNFDGSELDLSDFTEDITVLITGFETDDEPEAATVHSVADINEL